MGLFSLFPQSGAARYFDRDQVERIVSAVRLAEQQTSGEVRVFIETNCKYVDPAYRAAELFFGLKMDLTKERNAVLLYIAMNDHQFFIFADEGIYQEMGKTYWDEEAAKIVESFRHKDFTEGICDVVKDIGQALQSHFPYNRGGDKNELPDEIIFGQ